MYQIYKVLKWLKQLLFCVHDWTWKEYGIECRSFATCRKCGKFTDNT